MMTMMMMMSTMLMKMMKMMMILWPGSDGWPQLARITVLLPTHAAHSFDAFNDDDDGDDDDDYTTVLLIKAEHNIDFDVGRDDACRPELGKVAMVVMMVMKDVAMMIMTVVVVGLMMHVARNCCHDGDGGWTDGCADHSNEDDLQCLYGERRTHK